MKPLSEDDELIQSLEEVWIPLDTEPSQCKVVKIRPQKEHWLLLLEGVTDRNQSEAMKGKGVYVPEDWLRPLEDNEFFIHDLLQSKCLDENGVELGIIENYFENGPQIIFEVKGKDRNFLFPATASILLNVDPQAKEVVIHPPEGLLDLND